MGYQTPGVTTGGLPEHLIKPLVDNYDIPYLIETGTANGDSARLAATMFKKVWTTELVKDRAETKEAPQNVTFLEGDSAELLPKIIEELIKLKDKKEHQYVLFYLDAHYSGDVPNESDYPECPVLEEIKAIAEYGGDAIVIIDDSRLFFGPPPYPHDPEEWPSISEIFWMLSNFFPYAWNTIMDDYVISIPLHLKEALWKNWRDRYSIRYPSHKDNVKNQAKFVYEEFIKYINT